MKTGLFAVFDSQKSKDWTAGPVFSSLGPVWLRSFCSLETGLTNTNIYFATLNEITYSHQPSHDTPKLECRDMSRKNRLYEIYNNH